MDDVTLEQMNNAAWSARQKLERIRDDLVAKLAAIDRTRLRPEVVKHEEAKAREEARAAVDAVVAPLADLRARIAEAKAAHEPQRVRQRAGFAADPVRTLATYTRLQHATPRRLEALAALAAERGDLVTLDALDDVLASRGEAVPLDVQERIRESIDTGTRASGGDAFRLIGELENEAFLLEQIPREVAHGGRKHTTAELEAMSQSEFEASRRAEASADAQEESERGGPPAPAPSDKPGGDT
jgi:hypothetical protein